MSEQYFINSFSEEIWEQTFKNYKDENILDNWKRVAKDIASVEKNKEEWEIKFLEILKNFKFVPAGRIMANAGTEWKASYINCFVNPRNKYDLDSLNGIMSVLRDQAQTLKSEGGWGCNFSFIRPRGSFIHGVGVETPGAVKYMEIFNKTSDVITAGSGRKNTNKKAKGKIRKGAMMGLIDCWHPDIEEFIKAKQSEGRLDKFNISVGAYNDFMDKVVEIEALKSEGKEIPDELDRWDLIFPDTTFSKYKEEWFGDIYDWKQKGYPIKVHKTISVCYLWNLIMQSTYNRNDPGIVFLDIANKTHGWNYGDPKISKILATNPCFSGDTKIAVADGRNYAAIKELAEKGEDVPVYSLNPKTGKTEIKWGRNPRITGYDKKLLRVWFTDESYIDVTENHKFITQDFGTIEAKDLKAGDDIPSFFKDRDGMTAEFYGLENLQNKCSTGELVTKGEKKFEIERRLELAEKFGLDAFYDESKNDVFIKKVCEVSGTKFIVPWESREICCAPNQTINDLMVKQRAVDNKNIGLQKKSKDNLREQFMAFKDLSESSDRIPIKVGWEGGFNELKKVALDCNHRVKKIEELGGEHIVYNITVEDNHTVGIINDESRKSLKGIYTFQCGEQALPSGGCCNLGSLNLTQFLNEDYTNFDLEKIKETVKIAVRFLDNVNDRSYVPLSDYEWSMKNLRRIGLGLMGWGSSLFLLNLRYGSVRAEEIKKDLMKAIVYTGIEESINLAIEKGSFLQCNKELHWQNEYYNIIELSTEIRNKIKEHGIRNSSLFSIQPTGNTGILANNVSGGLEPIFMPEYMRTVICPNVPEHIKDLCPRYWEGEFYETEMFKFRKEGSDDVLVGKDKIGEVYKIDKNRGLTKMVLCEDYSVKLLKERGVWDKGADWAKTTMQLSVQDHIVDMKGFAKYMDSAISKTLNVPNNYPYKDFIKAYLDCYKTGVIKGFTTYRDGTMTSVLSAVKEDSNKNIELNTNSAPKRPTTLKADVHLVTAKGEKYIVAIGFLENGQLYEIFGGHSNGFNIKKSTGGKITKIKRGHYSLSIGEDVEIEDFSKQFTPQEQTLFRMASTMLRHGIPIEFVVEQMQKSTDDMFSLPKAVARVLKKYIKDGQKINGEECPSCKSHNLIYKEGCKSCSDCGWTACG